LSAPLLFLFFPFIPLRALRLCGEKEPFILSPYWIDTVREKDGIAALPAVKTMK
jgi:hypothetical protein